jgi:CDGSH-type Zn-finger protein
MSDPRLEIAIDAPTSTKTPNDEIQPLIPNNTFIKPCRAGPDQVEDIEDIIINGAVRARPDRIKWLCSFRRRLIPGEIYYWCQCGKSDDIYCDETCKEEPTRLGPLEFSVDADVSKHALCGCRYTAAPPFCDSCHIFPKPSLEEYIDENPKEKHLVPWLCKNNDHSENEKSAEVKE